MIIFDSDVKCITRAFCQTGRIWVLFRSMALQVQRKPDWLRVRLNTTESFRGLKRLVRQQRLTTVCEEARCPNIHECWGEHGTATFMILGDTCTRRCRFCAVKTGLPRVFDLAEPKRVADSVAEMALRHVVITMVNRDDLPDGGAGVMANTVRAIHTHGNGCTVEVLTSDFMERRESIAAVMRAKPAIFSHNLETVRRLTPQVRSRSDYDRSLRVMRIAREIDAETVTKSSLMLGLGETEDEVLSAMDDLRAFDVDMINLGQYLQPTRTHLPVKRYWKPEEFAELKAAALDKGFTHCDAGPLVRSSYHAGEGYEAYRKTFHPLYRQD